VASLSIFAIIVDCLDPRRQADWWANVLSYQVTERNTDEYQVGEGVPRRPSLYFMKVPERKVLKNRLHLDLITEGPMESEVARLVEAGARVVEVREDPDSLQNPDRWTVLTDPEDNEFCVTSRRTLTGWS
jgi:Glyoxalase-like domain